MGGLKGDGRRTWIEKSWGDEKWELGRHEKVKNMTFFKDFPVTYFGGDREEDVMRADKLFRFFRGKYGSKNFLIISRARSYHSEVGLRGSEGGWEKGKNEKELGREELKTWVP